MAEGFAKHFLFGENILIDSAGVRADGLNQIAVQVMQEINIDISRHTSKTLDSINLNQFHLVITVCDHAQSCVQTPLLDALVLHKNIPDPVMIVGTHDDQLIGYRKVREQIKSMVLQIINQHELIVKNGKK